MIPSFRHFPISGRNELWHEDGASPPHPDLVPSPSIPFSIPLFPAPCPEPARPSAPARSVQPPESRSLEPRDGELGVKEDEIIVSLSSLPLGKYLAEGTKQSRLWKGCEHKYRADSHPFPFPRTGPQNCPGDGEGTWDCSANCCRQR